MKKKKAYKYYVSLRNKVYFERAFLFKCHISKPELGGKKYILHNNISSLLE